MSAKMYHAQPQVAGRIAHKNIDEGVYSSSKRYITGMSVTSVKNNITGKIDIYDNTEKALIERKRKVKNIYLGYKYQLYAQMVCMEEMGYKVNHLYVHSLVDNKRTEIPMPDKKELSVFFKVIKDIFSQMQSDLSLEANTQKCKSCIYQELCRGDMEKFYL